MRFKTFRAEGGALTLFTISRADAQLEARANENDQVYFGRHGVELRPGDTVLDLGANVGSTARVAAKAVGPSGTVYGVEPLEDVCAALERNIGVWGAWAEAQGLRVGRIVAVQAGCGDGSSSTQTFTHYRKLTAMSTMYPDEDDAAAAVCSLIMNKPYGASLLENAAGALARAAPRLYRSIHTFAFKALLLWPAARVVCPMTTVSALIDRFSIEDVGLLKANVERAEADVLAGVEARHWPCIRQVALQVHDIGGRVAAVEQQLTGLGYRVTVWKEPRFKDCSLYMVYGVRPS